MDFLFLYSTVFNPSDRLERFKFESFPTPTRLLWKVFSHGAITARRLFLQICPPLSVARHSCIQLIELGYYGENENAQASKRQHRGIQTQAASNESSASTTGRSCSTLHVLYLMCKLSCLVPNRYYY